MMNDGTKMLIFQTQKRFHKLRKGVYTLKPPILLVVIAFSEATDHIVHTA